MTAVEATPILHPLQPVADCLEAIGEALDRAPSGPLPSSHAEVLEIVVTEAARLERQLRELRLRCRGLLRRAAWTTSMRRRTREPGSRA